MERRPGFEEIWAGWARRNCGLSDSDKKSRVRSEERCSDNVLGHVYWLLKILETLSLYWL